MVDGASALENGRAAEIHANQDLKVKSLSQKHNSTLVTNPLLHIKQQHILLSVKGSSKNNFWERCCLSKR